MSKKKANSSFRGVFDYYEEELTGNADPKTKDKKVRVNSRLLFFLKNPSYRRQVYDKYHDEIIYTFFFLGCAGNVLLLKYY